MEFFHKKRVKKIIINEREYFKLDDVIKSFDAKLTIDKVYLSDELIKHYIDENSKIHNGEVFLQLRGVFRVIQSIDTVESEKFKIWLAGLGERRISDFKKGV